MFPFTRNNEKSWEYAAWLTYNRLLRASAFPAWKISRRTSLIASMPLMEVESRNKRVCYRPSSRRFCILNTGCNTAKAKELEQFRLLPEAPVWNFSIRVPINYKESESFRTDSRGAGPRSSIKARGSILEGGYGSSERLQFKLFNSNFNIFQLLLSSNPSV